MLYTKSGRSLWQITSPRWEPTSLTARRLGDSPSRTPPLSNFRHCSRPSLCLNGGQFFAGNALTYADLMIVVLQDNVRSSVISGGDVIEKFPKLCNLYQRVTALPNIKAWRGSRPIDPMFNN